MCRSGNQQIEIALSRKQKPPRNLNTILYVVSSLEVGGTERHVALVAPRLKRIGWDTSLYCLWERGAQAAEVERAGVKVIGPPHWTVEARAPGIIRVGRYTLSVLKLLALMLQHRPQIAHFYLPAPYLLGAPLALLLRIPICVMSRRSLNLYQRGRAIARWLEYFLHRRMDAVLGNSRSVARELVAEGCPPERVGVIYNGIDLAAILAAPTAARSDFGFKADALMLISVANLIPYKGHADLLRTLASIDAQMPHSWALFCIGRDDGLGATLRELTSQLGLGAKVRFLGQRTDVPALLKAAHIGILCSHEEGFSNAVIEGLAAGLPMIVTDVGGNAEAVLHEETGLVVPPHDPILLGQAILRLASDPSARQRMGEAARSRAAEYFTIEQCVAQYDRLYRALLAGRRPADLKGIGFMIENTSRR